MSTTFDTISIKIASPDHIKDQAKVTSCRRRNTSQPIEGPFICPEKGTCSCGEVRKAETINYRSFRPEAQGLFCEAIFGPQKNWECSCGKYKRIKHKGMICDRCGVEVTEQRVRRERLGYIQLAAHAAHIWYIKGMPSRIGTFCQFSSRDVERVNYFEASVVLEFPRLVTEVSDPACQLEVEVGDILSETIGDATFSSKKIKFHEMLEEYPDGFKSERPHLVVKTPPASFECSYNVGDYLSAAEYYQVKRNYPGLKATSPVSLADSKRPYMVVKTPECPFDVGDYISETEYRQAQKDYPGLKAASVPLVPLDDSERPHLIFEIPPESSECPFNVGDYISETEYRQAQEDYPGLKAAPPLLFNDDEHSGREERRHLSSDRPHVVVDLPLKSLKSSECPFNVGDYLSETDYEQAQKDYPGLEATLPTEEVKPRDILSDIQLADLSLKHDGGWLFDKLCRTDMGARALHEILRNINLDEEINKEKKISEGTVNKQLKNKSTKLRKYMEDFKAVSQEPEWMIQEAIPVIPPDLRPLVPLEGGRFATSDLNDLYRRVINRNNRLLKLIQLRSPEVILRNEKRMLQESVDAFLDNGRRGKRVGGPGGRPLKSVSDVLKGKIGRFRQNLLGKRVDYSGRSVIVVGPELGLHQCGIPKRMAVELFKPFIVERLQAYGYTETIKRAKHIAENLHPDSPVWEIVEEVIADHPVLLNRPPTLHRLGIQAFLPVLVEGKSIRIPPLVCKAFNADFDGDQMAVHVPLTVESQAEAKLLMLSSHNILKPSHGDPVTVPELDMVLGPCFLTKVLPEHEADAAKLHELYVGEDPEAFEELQGRPWYYRRYAHPEEVLAAHEAGQLKLHDSIQLFFSSHGNGVKRAEPILTTVGRVIFNEVLPSELKWEDVHSQQMLPFFNTEAGGRQLSDLIQRCFNELGTRATAEVLENVQKLAFEYATLSGISPGIQDYITPEKRDESVNAAQSEIDKFLRGVSATESEELTAEREELENKQIRIWMAAFKAVENEMFEALPRLEIPLIERGDPRRIHPYVDPTGAEIENSHVEGFSPVHIMADSGARARKNPFMQISAVIGLKAKQSGEILIPPITSSYRDGLSALDYFNSTYGSRKGLVDTAMKTAASGYLTRKLVDVAQDVRVTADDCGTLNSIQKFATDGGPLAFKINGRTAAEDIVNPEDGTVLVEAGRVISAENAGQIEALGIKVVRVRSVLTCETEDGVCAKCYGNDVTTNRLVNVGEAVGIIAAQSIGEPGTQLTMRTFHTGGAVEDVSEATQRSIPSKATGTVHFRDFEPGRTVEKEGAFWVVTENRASLDGPAYKVTQVNHPDCRLQVGELLSEKQWTENTERYPGFDTKTWLYEVTEVLADDCDLRVGDRLSQVEYARGQIEYGFQRFVTPKMQVKHVHHPKLSLAAGDLITEEEVEALKSGIRDGISGEWHYVDAQTKEQIAVEDITAAVGVSADADSQDSGFKRVYCISEIDAETSETFGFKVGDEISPEEIEPLLTPFEVESAPVYVIHREVSGFEVGQILPAREYEDARLRYQHFQQAFKVEKQNVERHSVTAVYHPECPLTVGEELSETALTRARKRFTGFDAERLRHRITQVYHPDCLLKPGDLISDDEVKRLDRNYPGFVTSESKNTAGSFAVERFHRVTAVNHSDCSLEVGELLTQKESAAKRREYKGFEVSRHYEVTHIEDGTTELSVSQRLSEVEYKALRKTDKSLPEKVKSLYHIVSVHHPKAELKVGDELSDDVYRKHQRQFKGFDYELVYRVTEDGRDIDAAERFEAGTILSSKEYRALEKANVKVTHTVTDVYHPNFPHGVGDELSEDVYKAAKEEYRSFEVDQLALQMRIEVETSEGTRSPHVIPPGYSFSLAEGDKIKHGDPLAELHERTENLDIVAGIPRVTELFEARPPKREKAAEIAEIEGYIRPAGTKSGVPTYRIEDGEHKSRLYQIPDEKRRVDEGAWVNAGDRLTTYGDLNPHDILKVGRTTIEDVPVEGEEAVWAYLVDEVQKVYGMGVINDKHVETVVRQMLTKVRIKEAGDTEFDPGDEVPRKRFETANARVQGQTFEREDGEETLGIPATGEPILQRISQASLSTDSFISAASFQQTTKVLTDAVCKGVVDRLFGLKENVILGRLIPAGSGFSNFQNLEVTSSIDSEIGEAGEEADD